MSVTQRLPIEPARLALVLALVLLVGSGDPNPTQVTFWLVFAVLLAASIWRPVGLATLGALVVAAIALRLAWNGNIGSDSLRVTKVAIDRVLAALNPYGYAYQASSPPGAPFPYGPLALFLYLPFHHAATLLELLTGVAVAIVLALQGRLIGLAVYAVMSSLVSIATDGANDTTLGFLILIAFMAARRWPIGGAFLLACAVAFKLSALAFAPGFLLWVGLRPALMFVAASVMAWSPVIANWGIASFLESARMADAVHGTRTIWSFGVLVKELADQRIAALDQLKYVAGGLIALVGLRFRRSMDGVILVGLAVYLVTLYGGNWGTYAYLGGIAPLICWRLDDWVGLESVSMRVRVGALRATWARRRARPAIPAAGESTA